MGRITEIRATPGEAIRRGQILIVLDGRDVEGSITQAQGGLAQARASASFAETNYARYQKLHDRGSASAVELDQARQQQEAAQGAVLQAEGALAAARSFQSYAEIAAPFDGRLVERYCELGDLAAPGQPLLKVEDARSTRLHVWLGAEHAPVPGVGDTVFVEVPSAKEERIAGRVAEVVPAADPATHTTLIKVDLGERPGLRSGLYGRAFFASEAREVLMVPRSALRIRGGLTGVFVVEDGKANLRWLQLDPGTGETVEVLAGLEEGQTFLPDPPEGLRIGTPVEVLR
jgi:RND family efflux transporter MFP subunit